jgi:hypothetical protein
MRRVDATLQPLNSNLLKSRSEPPTTHAPSGFPIRRII